MIDKHESITAKICSFVRAYHSAYSKQKIFDDYLAYDLLGQSDYIKIGQLIEHGYETEKYRKDEHFSKEQIEKHVIESLSPIPLSRIAYTEQKLCEFARVHEKTQYVLLGAGLDTFSFRNADKSIEIFELDHPDTGRYKLEKVKELELIVPDNVHFVAIDFNHDNLIEVLKKSGFDTHKPAVFSILGVTYYLSLDVFDRTLQMIDELTDSSAMVIFDYPDETTLVSTDEDSRVYRLRMMTKKLGENMVYGYRSEELVNALEKHNFKVYEHKDPQMLQSMYFQDRTDGMKAYENVHLLSGIK